MRTHRAWTTGLSALALAGAAVLSGAGPALAVTDVQKVIDTCSMETVCTFEGSITNPSGVKDSLPEGVRVVVIKSDQAQSVPPGDVATAFKKATGVTTVIVIEDRQSKDLSFVASDGNEEKIAAALNSQGKADGGEAVIGLPAGTLTQTPADTADSGGVSTGVVAGGGFALLVAAAAAGGVMFVRRRRKARGTRPAITSKQLEKELDDALNGPDGDIVRASIERLQQRAQAYPAIGGQVSSLAQHVSELFVRVRKRGTDQQVRLLQSQYKDTLSKLLKALDADYYGDITANPQYWSNPNDRLAEVQRAVASVDQQAVENIRQVNESRDLDFKVALDSLIETVTEAKLSDVYTDREK